MSINCYSGLQGSGKSYEVVSSIIIPAVAQGRRVVTNISGIDNDGIRAYCCEKFNIELDKLGSVSHAKNEEVSSKDFFPTEDTHQQAECTSFVHPGDLVAIDEAYKIWGSDCKIRNEHKVFFREHRHYVHAQTGVLFTIKPDIKDADIDVQVDQQVSNFVNTTTGVNNSPTLTKRQLQTSVSVKNDDVIVIGGLKTEKKSDSNAGLSFLPAFLGSSTNDNGQSEIILFLQVQKI